MNKYFYFIFALLAVTETACNAQDNFKQEFKGQLVFYEANKGIQFKIVKFKKGTEGGFNEELYNEFKLSPKNFLFKIVSKKKPDDTKRDYKIVLISFSDFEMVNAKKTFADSVNTAVYINPDDNGSIFWMREDDFTDLVAQQSVREFHLRRYPSFAYAGTLSVPFKMRPATSDQFLKITPEFELGGYAGIKFRLSRYSDFTLTCPVVTVGVCIIGINDNNTINENAAPSAKTPDALVFGRTFSTGLILQYNQFQLGMIAGWDKASGQVGKNWIYNDRLWYSFSIGFSFFKTK